MKTCQLVFVPKISRLAKVDGVSIWNAQPPHGPVLFGPSSPGHWHGPTLQETLHLGLPGENGGKTTNKNRKKRKVFSGCVYGISRDLRSSIGFMFFVFCLFFLFRVGYKYTVVVSFSWKELNVEWARWKMGKEGWWWLLGKTSRLVVYVYMYMYMLYIYIWRYNHT